MLLSSVETLSKGTSKAWYTSHGRDCVMSHTATHLLLLWLGGQLWHLVQRHHGILHEGKDDNRIAAGDHGRPARNRLQTEPSNWVEPRRSPEAQGGHNLFQGRESLETDITHWTR